MAGARNAWMTKSKQDEGGIPLWSKDEDQPNRAVLDPQQYAAGVKAHELFVSMADGPEEERPSKHAELFSFLPRLDAHRHNHTVLVDGTRGSGKTAVMLRLLQDWSETLTNPKALETPLDKMKPNDGGQLVPVGLLDLESVPKAANLATRIAGMFERVVGAMERRGTKDRGAPVAPAWAALEDDTLKSRQAWRHFVHAAALEWDPSVERRRAHIDPEAYVVEVEQAERKGLQARECFREFIDALTDDWKSWPLQKGGRPFFVVPIDDADLNPGRVVELFGLLRTLWHPRVGYLLTGDGGLFEHVLATHFRSQVDLPQLGGPTTMGGFRVQLIPDSQRVAERLAKDYYQKAVSLENCLKLEPLRGKIRLAFIQEALEHRGTGILKPLAQYLGVDDISRLVLPGRWRKLRDLRDSVRKGDFDTELGSERFALKLWNDALDDASLVERELDVLRQFARLDPEQSVLEFDLARMPSIRTDAARGVRVVQVTGQARTYIYYGHRFRLGVGSGEWPTDSDLTTFRRGSERRALNENRLIQLDDSLVAAWLLLSNVGNFPGFWPFDFILVGSSVSVDVSVGELSSSILRFVWPSLERSHQSDRWPVLFDRQWLFKEWNERAPKYGEDLGGLARFYLSLMMREPTCVNVEELGWGELAVRIVASFGRDEIRLGNWPLRAALLAAPEWGLPPHAANEWLRMVKQSACAVDKWDELRPSLRRFRFGEIESAVHAGLPADERPDYESGQNVVEFNELMGQVVEDIDTRAPGYHWHAAVHADPVGATSPVAPNEAPES
jgi:hypothetical protein